MMYRKLTTILLAACFVCVLAFNAMAQDNTEALPEPAPCEKVIPAPCAPAPVCTPAPCVKVVCPQPCVKVVCPPPTCYKIVYVRGLFGCCRATYVPCCCDCCQSDDGCCNSRLVRVGCFRTIRLCGCNCGCECN